MRRTTLFSLAILLLLGEAVGLSALGLDVELKGGGGMAMGTTDDSNKSGELRYALDAGLSLDIFLVKLGRLSLGLSGGAGYANLNYHGVWENLPNPAFGTFGPPATTTQTSDSTYQYFLFPVSLAGKVELGKPGSLNLRAGAFAGYFLTGTTDLSYAPEIGTGTGYPVDVWVNGEEELNEGNTELWMYGLSFYAGLDVFTAGRLSITPSIQFDLGLTDTSVDLPFPPASNDTFWALTANVGIRYRLLQ